MGRDELQRQLIALREGDRAAFADIYEALKTPMFAIILRITRDRALSEDVLQEVFIKLYRAPPEPTKNARAYLFQMARNLAIDSVRKRRKLAGLEDAEIFCLCDPLDDLPRAMDTEAALRTLPSAECQIVSLHINGTLTFREIAAVMDMPLGTVLWRYQKALGRLRATLSEV